MSTRLVATTLTAACLSVVAAGCSSSGSSPSAVSTSPSSATPSRLSAAAYRSALHRVAQEEAAAQSKVQRAFHANGVKQVRTALASFGADQRHVAARVGALAPPADAVAANAQLAKAFHDNAAAIASLLTKLAPAKTVKQALTIIQSDQAAQRVGHEIDTALAMLKKLGYTSGS
jgi:hypothetical protein